MKNKSDAALLIALRCAFLHFSRYSLLRVREARQEVGTLGEKLLGLSCVHWIVDKELSSESVADA